MRSIAEVERETSLPRATLRIWERRYGFPAPLRDDRDERVYPADQVAQLRLMRELIEQGHRPAKLVAAGAAEIARLARGSKPVQSARTSAARPEWLELLQRHDDAALRAALEARLARNGIACFVGEELPELNRLVGEWWSQGELQVHEEHLYSDCLHQVLRVAIADLSRSLRPEAPRALLTTFPQEHHGLGLLMAQTMLAHEGCPCVSLGVRLPIEQIVAGTRAYGADLVGLSFTASQNPSHVLRGLEELRGLLPVSVRIWAGGNSPALRTRAIPGVRAVADVRDIPAFLAEDFALPPRRER